MEQGIWLKLYKYWHVVKKYKRSMAAIIIVVLIVAVIINVAPKIINVVPSAAQKSYKAQAIITPVVSGGGGMMSMLAQQFSNLPFISSGLGGMATFQSTQFMTIFRSRTFAENVINSTNLMPILFKNMWDERKQTWKVKDPKKIPGMLEAAWVLTSYVKIMEDKKLGTIKIIADFPKVDGLALKVVNAYLDELQKYLDKSTLSLAKRNKLFIEKQLEENKRMLLEAGKEISRYYRENQVSSSVPFLDIDVNQDIAIPMGRTDIDEPKRLTYGDLISSTSLLNRSRVVHAVPQQVYLQYITLRQNLLGRINAMLAQQYEIAKIDEAKQNISFRVIDRPAVVMAGWPKPLSNFVNFVRMLIYGVFLAVFYAFFMEYIKQKKAEFVAWRKKVFTRPDYEIDEDVTKPDKAFWKKIISDRRTPEMYKDVVKTEDEGPQA